MVSLPDDPDLWLLRDCMFDATGTQVSMFWQAVTTEGNELPVPVTTSPIDPRYYLTHIYQTFPRDPTAVLPQMPDQVTLRIRIQPIGLDVLGDMVSTGYLDAGIVPSMPTWDAAPLITWTPAATTLTYVDDLGERVTCVSATDFNVGADKNLAIENAGCTP